MSTAVRSGALAGDGARAVGVAERRVGLAVLALVGRGLGQAGLSLLSTTRPRIGLPRIG